MIKLIKTVLISAAIICSSSSLAFENKQSVESLQECNQKNLPTSAQLQDLREKNQNVALILKDDRYCIKSFEKLNSLYSDVSTTSDKLYDLRKRYNSELQKLDSLEDKVIFADLFLQKASRTFVITIPMQLNKNSLSVTFVRKSHAIGSATGESFSLLGGVEFSGEIVKLYNSLIALQKSASQEILDSVKYVISGKKSNND